MFTILVETFLYEYLLYNSILGGKFYDHKKLYSVLSDMFCLTEQEVSPYFNLTESKAIKGISTEDEYKRYKRLKQFNAMVGNEQCYSDMEDALIAIKGDAITTAAQFGMLAESEWTETLTKKTLMGNAEIGNIIALRMCGILECEGLVLRKNVCGGIKHLKKAMQWGDIPACLAMLKYSDMDKITIIKMLNSAVNNTPYEFLSRVAEDRYYISTDNEFSEEILMIKQAFIVNKLKQDTYDSIYARLIYSDIIGIKDKEKALFAENKEIISDTCDLPLRLNYETIEINESAFCDMALNRKNEKDGILQGLDCNDLRINDSYRPLCICSSSDYILRTYESVICNSFKSANIEKIDVSEIGEADAEPTKNNIFVRGLNENKNNVYILHFKGEIGDGAFKFAKSFLKSEKRRKFHLNRPAVALNLSSVLPICVCDKEYAKKLKDLVEIVDLAPIKKEEMIYVVKDVLNKKIKSYSMEGKIKYSDDTLEKLYELPIETTEKVFDKIMRINRKKSETLDLNMNLIKPYLNKKTSDNNVYGFGGTIDGNK